MHEQDLEVQRFLRGPLAQVGGSGAGDVFVELQRSLRGGAAGKGYVQDQSLQQFLPVYRPRSRLFEYQNELVEDLLVRCNRERPVSGRSVVVANGRGKDIDCIGVSTQVV